MSRFQFLDKYVEHSILVVIADQPEWTAFSKFTPEFFKTNYGHIERVINGKKYTFAELIDLCAASQPGNTSPYPLIFDMKVYFSRVDSGYKTINKLWQAKRAVEPVAAKIF